MSPEPDSIATVTKSLSDHQKLLAETYKDLVIKTLQGAFDLSEDLIRHIAGFASPRGSDVRLAWHDEEGYCQDISV